MDVPVIVTFFSEVCTWYIVNSVRRALQYLSNVVLVSSHTRAAPGEVHTAFLNTNQPDEFLSLLFWR